MMSFPIFSNDYGSEFAASKDMSNRKIVNGLSEQAELVRAGLGGALFNEVEYQAVFANDKSVKKIPVNINGHSTISYIGLTNGEEGFSEALTDFFRAFCGIF